MEENSIVQWIKEIRRQIRIFKWNKVETTFVYNLERAEVGNLQLFQRSLSDRIQIAVKEISDDRCRFSQLHVWQEKFYIDFDFRVIGVNNEILEITSRVYYTEIEDDLSDQDSECEYDPRYDDDLDSHASDGDDMFYVSHTHFHDSLSLNNDD
jgi:hypothetical protein